MKKTVVILIIAVFISVLFLSSCGHDDSLAATANISWAQLTDAETNSLSIVYSIKNTGKEDILGYSIVFTYSGGFASSIKKVGGRVMKDKPAIFPAIEQELENPILPGEIYVEEESYTLGEGTVVESVVVSKLHVWSERKERIYEY